MINEKDLKYGQKKEDGISSIFYMAGCSTEKANSDKRQDFYTRVNEKQERIEVKNEDRFADSGNICIETVQGTQRSPAGIFSTESTVMIHTLMDMAVIYRTVEMRNQLLWNNKKLREKNHWKDKFGNADNQNGGFIIPIELFHKDKFGWYDYCHIMELPKSKIFRFK